LVIGAGGLLRPIGGLFWVVLHTKAAWAAASFGFASGAISAVAGS
jgi:hypothetical protein